MAFTRPLIEQMYYTPKKIDYNNFSLSDAASEANIFVEKHQLNKLVCDFTAEEKTNLLKRFIEYDNVLMDAEKFFWNTDSMFCVRNVKDASEVCGFKLKAFENYKRLSGTMFTFTNTGQHSDNFVPKTKAECELIWSDRAKGWIAEFDKDKQLFFRAALRPFMGYDLGKLF